MLYSFDEKTMKETSVDNKIGLLSLMEPGGYPHVTFLSSLQANSPQEITWGQFCAGTSKQLVREKTKTGFLVLGLTKDIYRGTADYSDAVTTGDVMDLYNNKPIFRYNSYFGFSKVHKMRLRSLYETEHVDMLKIVAGAVKSKIAAAACKKSKNHALSPISLGLASAIDGLKFIAYENTEGYPVIIPVIQATAAGLDRMVFSLIEPYKKELLQIPTGAKVALFCASMKMELVLIQGKFDGIKKRGGIQSGMIEIERVYNPMPPQPAVIYPRRTAFEAVTEF